MLMDIIRRLREKWRWRRERIARLNAARSRTSGDQGPMFPRY